MKKKLLCFGLALLASIVMVACAKTDSTETESQESPHSSLEHSTSSSEEASNETQRIGSDEYGYIDIPKNWLRFTDVDGNDSIQYTDGSGYNIVTLNGYTREKANVAPDEEFTAEMIANRIASIWNDNPNVAEMWGAKTEVSGNEAFQVNIILKSGQYLVTWTFKQGENIYMIAYEGTKESLVSFIPYIEETWSTSK